MGGEDSGGSPAPDLPPSAGIPFTLNPGTDPAAASSGGLSREASSWRDVLRVAPVCPSCAFPTRSSGVQLARRLAAVGVGRGLAVSVSFAASSAGLAVGTSALGARQVQHLLAGCFPELVPPLFFDGLRRDRGKEGNRLGKGPGRCVALVAHSQHPELFAWGQQPAREAQGAWMCGVKTSGNRSAGHKSRGHRIGSGGSVRAKASVPPACGTEI